MTWTFFKGVMDGVTIYGPENEMICENSQEIIEKPYFDINSKYEIIGVNGIKCRKRD